MKANLYDAMIQSYYLEFWKDDDELIESSWNLINSSSSPQEFLKYIEDSIEESDSFAQRCFEAGVLHGISLARKDETK